jgi:hypothetical protein
MTLFALLPLLLNSAIKEPAYSFGVLPSNHVPNSAVVFHADVGNIFVSTFNINGLTTLNASYRVIDDLGQPDIRIFTKSFRGNCLSIWFHDKSDQVVCETRLRQYQLSIAD